MINYQDRISEARRLAENLYGHKNDSITPMAVVDKIGNLRGKKLFNSIEEKIFDPFCGCGAFLLFFIDKFFNSKVHIKEFPNPKKRLEHIIKNQIYGNDIKVEKTRITGNLIDFILPGAQKNIENKDFRVYNNKMLKEFNIVGNPPYTEDDVLLYTYFFEQALQGKRVVFVMPADLDSQQVRLKNHNKRVKKHLVTEPENVSEYFNVGLTNINLIDADPSRVNVVPEYEDPYENMPILYPERKRLTFVRGFGQYSWKTNKDDNGEEVYVGILRDGFKTRNITKKIIAKDNKKDLITNPYIVMIGENPSNGLFNIEVIENKGKPFGSGIFAVGVDTMEIGNNLKSWLQSDEIKNEVKKMLEAKGTYSLSGDAIQKLPWYE